MLLVLAILGGLMAGLRYLQSRQAIHPELSRKMVHIGMGVTTLFFPLLFPSPVPVLILSAVSVVLMVAVKRVSFLKSRIGSVLNAVERASLGDVCFPVAVAILFYLSKNDRMLYWIPIMILTFGDAIAALIGVRYGIKRYAGVDGYKSIEGSIALFTVSFLSVHIPLLLFTGTGRAESLLIGLIIGALVTIIEAVAWSGLDNLFLPLGAYLMLYRFLSLDVFDLIARLIVVVFLVVFVIAWRRRTTLQDSALLCAALSGYLFWAIGGFQWLVPPLVLFCTYPLLAPHGKERMERLHSMKSVVGVVSVGFFWLFLGYAMHRASMLFPFTLSFAIQLSLIIIVRSRHNRAAMSSIRTITLSVLKSSLVVGLVYLAITHFTKSAIEEFFISFGVLCVVVPAFWAAKPRLEEQPTDTRLLIQQAGFAVCGSAVGLMVMGG
jgi:phytol kinase